MISITKVKETIAQGNLDDSFEILLEQKNSQDETTNYELILLKSRDRQFKKMERLGVLNSREASVERNQIVYALLDLLKNMHENEDVDTAPIAGEESFTPDTQDITQILFLHANPADAARLFLDKEIREIEEKLARSKKKDMFSFKSIGAVRVQDLNQAMLDYEPHFVHFSGHGTEEGIVLINNHGSSFVVNQDALANLFKMFSDKIACVFLNSCYSEPQAHKINLFIPNVIGMRKEVSDDAAIAFSTSFYQSIASGKGIDFSFEFAKNAISLFGLKGVETPVFLSR